LLLNKLITKKGIFLIPVASLVVEQQQIIMLTVYLTKPLRMIRE